MIRDVTEPTSAVCGESNPQIASFEMYSITSPEGLRAASTILAGLKRMATMAFNKKCRVRMEFVIRGKTAGWCFTAFYDARDNETGRMVDRTIGIERGSVPLELLDDVIDCDISYLSNVLDDIRRWV